MQPKHLGPYQKPLTDSDCHMIEAIMAQLPREMPFLKKARLIQRFRGIQHTPSALGMPFAFSLELHPFDEADEALVIQHAQTLRQTLQPYLDNTDLLICNVHRFVEITKNANKGTALDFYCDYHTIDRKTQVIALGDSGNEGGNDVPMLKNVWKAVHVGDLPPVETHIQHFPGHLDATKAFLFNLSIQEKETCKLLALDNDYTISVPYEHSCELDPFIETWLLAFMKDNPHRRVAILTGRGVDIVADRMLGVFFQTVLHEGLQDQLDCFIFNGSCQIQWHLNGQVNTQLEHTYYIREL